MSEPLVDYISVKNRSRAELFYQKLFPKAAFRMKGRAALFDMGGHVFGLLEANHEADCQHHCRKSAPHLRLEVTDVWAEAAKLIPLAVRIVEPVHEAGYFRVVQFKDTEGNTIELYQTLLALD